MSSESEIVDVAIRHLPVRSTFRANAASYRVLFLLPHTLWRPFKASWWTGKEVCVIGGDPDGNYYLRHSDGSVSYWHHGRKADQVLAPSVRVFMTTFEPPGNA